jgi:malonyl-CoA decarboxylase
LQPEDRRCFGFFHPSMPDEPLIFVEVALTKGVPASVDGLLSEDREVLPQTGADTATFYSISSCQIGLAGISFGNSLIKQVVADLSLELPNLKTFVTLSPIPCLQRWLEQQGIATPARNELVGLAAHYLLSAKLPNGAPFDPVARFHLGNGAMIHALHPNADSSGKGQSQSGGVMVNYLYDLSKIVRNHERFASDYTISAAPALRALAEAVTLATPK